MRECTQGSLPPHQPQTPLYAWVTLLTSAPGTSASCVTPSIQLSALEADTHLALASNMQALLPGVPFPSLYVLFPQSTHPFPQEDPHPLTLNFSEFLPPLRVNITAAPTPLVAGLSPLSKATDSGCLGHLLGPGLSESECLAKTE